MRGARPERLLSRQSRRRADAAHRAAFADRAACDDAMLKMTASRVAVPAGQGHGCCHRSVVGRERGGAITRRARGPSAGPGVRRRVRSHAVGGRSGNRVGVWGFWGVFGGPGRLGVVAKVVVFSDSPLADWTIPVIVSLTAALVDPRALHADDGPLEQAGSWREEREQSQKPGRPDVALLRALGASNVVPCGGQLARAFGRADFSVVISRRGEKCRESLLKSESSEKEGAVGCLTVVQLPREGENKQ